MIGRQGLFGRPAAPAPRGPVASAPAQVAPPQGAERPIQGPRRDPWLKDPASRLPPDARAKYLGWVNEQADLGAVLQSLDQQRHNAANTLRDAESFADRVQTAHHSSNARPIASSISSWITGRGTPGPDGVVHYQPPKAMPPDENQLTASAQAVEDARAALQALNARIASVQARRSKLVDNLTTWLTSLPPNVVLQPYVRPTKAAPAGTTVEDVEAARRQIQNLTAEIGTVQASGQPADVAIQKMRGQIALLASQGEPSIASLLDHDHGSVRFSTENVSSHILTPAGASVGNTTLVNALALVAWAMHDQIVARLEEAILDQVEPGAMTAEQKAQRIAEITAQVRVFSRLEEEIIEASEMRGAPIVRRAEADPYAVLGVI